MRGDVAAPEHRRHLRFAPTDALGYNSAALRAEDTNSRNRLQCNEGDVGNDKG